MIYVHLIFPIDMFEICCCSYVHPLYKYVYQKQTNTVLKQTHFDKLLNYYNDISLTRSWNYNPCVPACDEYTLLLSDWLR